MYQMWFVVLLRFCVCLQKVVKQKRMLHIGSCLIVWGQKAEKNKAQSLFGNINSIERMKEKVLHNMHTVEMHR